MNCITSHTSWFFQFLTRLESSLPLLISFFFLCECMFTHCASRRPALLFSHHFQTGVPTSYSTVLHWPGAHSSNCVKFAQHVFVCKRLLMCVTVWPCKRIFCICSSYLCVHLCFCTKHKLYLQYTIICRRLQRLILK